MKKLFGINLYIFILFTPLQLTKKSNDASFVRSFLQSDLSCLFDKCMSVFTDTLEHSLPIPSVACLHQLSAASYLYLAEPLLNVGELVLEAKPASWENASGVA